jgi:hypothetical protein
MANAKALLLAGMASLSKSAKALSLHSFHGVVAQAQQTDVALTKVEEHLIEALRGTKVASIDLPRLGVNATQADRLHFPEGTLKVLVRDLTRTLFNAILKGQSIYVSGSQGIGKTHALYTCACALRMLREAVRVTYIQSCKKWVSSHEEDDYLYILNELCDTFQDDKISKQGKITIADWATWVMEAKPKTPDRKQRFAELVVVVKKYVSDANLRWISIFDQENGLYKPRNLIERGVYPFTLDR